MKLLKLSILVAALLVTAACARLGPGAGTGSPPAGAAAQPDLTGTWILDRGRSPTGLVPLPAGMVITISFQDGTVGGQACNYYGGDYVQDGGALTISALAMTEMACQEDIMAAEAGYHAALTDVIAASRDGDTLVLRGDASELVYHLRPPVPDAEITGTTWVLESIITGDVVASLPYGLEATLTMAADGTFSGSTGCRTFTGDYALSGDRVAVPSLAMDGDCPADAAATDATVVGVLEGGFSVQVSGDRLTLSDNDGQSLEYRAAG